MSDKSSLIVEQIPTACLSQFSYYIESNGESVIIDPMRDSTELKKILKYRKSKLKYVFETHFHADFVSGNADFVKQGATVVYGPNAGAHFAFHEADDLEVFQVGNVTIKCLHTPGHTLESSCYLLTDHTGKDLFLFTGDTVLLGTLGRPDLAVSKDIIAEDLARMLYNSVQTKFKPLDDTIIVYPGHGAGSACGKNIVAGRSDRMDNVKATNAFFNMSEEEFVTEMLKGLKSPPGYFFHDAKINKQGASSFDDSLVAKTKPFPIASLASLDKEVVILDVREKDDFILGHLPGSLFISLDMPFANWVGVLFSPNDRFLLVCPKGFEEETVSRLLRIGYENIEGYLEGGYENYAKSGKPVSSLRTVTPKEMVEKTGKLGLHETLVDVREVNEFKSESIDKAVNVPLSTMSKQVTSLKKENELYVFCASGKRSVIGASILQKNGYKPISINEGFAGLKANKANLVKRGFSILNRFIR